MKDYRGQTYYELLEIEPTAGQEEILRAYNKARTTYNVHSPALYSMFTKEEAQDLLHLIDEAYMVLSNQYKRKQYDANHGYSSENENPSRQTPIDVNETASQIGHELKAHVVEKDFSDQAIPDASSVEIHGTSRLSSRGEDFTEDVLLEAKQAIVKSPSESNIRASQQATGMTKFGPYKVDDQLEAEILGMEDFSGPVLKNIRIYKNVSIDQISDSTKISRPYLTALETDDYKMLPAPVFVRGFLVQFAKLLNLDPDKVSKSYLNQMKIVKKA